MLHTNTHVYAYAPNYNVYTEQDPATHMRAISDAQPHNTLLPNSDDATLAQTGDSALSYSTPGVRVKNRRTMGLQLRMFTSSHSEKNVFPYATYDTPLH